MSAVWGRKVRYTIFGESHGAGIGIVIDGLPAGILLDQTLIHGKWREGRPAAAIWPLPAGSPTQRRSSAVCIRAGLTVPLFAP